MGFRDLQNYLRLCGIANFSAREIAKRDLPPSHLWSRIIPTLQVVERLRAHPDISFITVTSGYRSPEHNKNVGGAPGSQHVWFNALDIIPMKTARDRVDHLFCVQVLEQDPLFSFLGLGVYSSFLHIDTRGLFNKSGQGARF